MTSRKHHVQQEGKLLAINTLPVVPLWELNIAELTGHNLEARGREKVNRLLQSGWMLLYIYTLKYEEDGVWRERPMAILGRPRGDRREIRPMNQSILLERKSSG